MPPPGRQLLLENFGGLIRIAVVEGERKVSSLAMLFASAHIAFSALSITLALGRGAVAIPRRAVHESFPELPKVGCSGIPCSMDAP